MSLIKRFITREWFNFFIAAFASLFSLLTVGNFISDFLRTNVNAKEIFYNYLLQIPSYINQIVPVSCLIASLFSINKLKTRNELTAIFASGYSRQQFVIDLITISTYVAIFQFLVSAFIGPYVASKKYDLMEDSLNKFRNLKSSGVKSSISSGEIWYKSGNYYFSFSHFDKQNQSINNVMIYTFDSEYKLKSLSSVKSLVYDKETKMWNPTGYTEIDDLNLKAFPSIEELNVPILLNEKIDDFNTIESDITTLNIFKLYEYISQLSRSGINSNEYYVTFFKHFSDSLICIVFALLAAIPIFNPNRRNSSFGKSASLVFSFTLFYWLIQSYFVELGINLKIYPSIACFSIPALFIIFIVIVFYKNRKLA